MNIQNLGFKTDCFIKEADGVVVEKPDYFVIRMPSNPTFHWGNFLLFKSSPKASDYSNWIEAFMKEFRTESGHVTFGWDVPEIGDIQGFKDNGFELCADSVLKLLELRRPKRSGNGIQVRKIASDADWQSVVDLQIRVFEGGNPPEGFAEFIYNLFRTYRRLSDKGRGDWWGAFSENTLVGDMGLFFDKDFKTGRFQSVETHPDYRRQGICSSLLHEVARQSMESSGVRDLVICTEKDSAAWMAYKSVGFEHATFQYGVSLPCRYDKRFEQSRSRN